MLTPAATRFVGPLSFAALSRHPVETDVLELLPDGRIGHIVVADTRRRDRRRPGDRPLARRDGERAGRRRRDRDLPRDVGAGRRRARRWTATCGRHPATGRQRRPPARRFGYAIVEPDSGPLASGQSGVGRLAELPAHRRRGRRGRRPIARSARPDPGRAAAARRAGPRRGPRRPPHRGDRRRHARGDRPGPLHRQPLDRADGRRDRRGGPRPRRAGDAHRGERRASRLPRRRDGRPGRVDRRPASGRSCGRRPDRRTARPASTPWSWPRPSPTSGPADRRRTKLTRGDGLTLELEPTPDLLAEVARIAAGLDSDGRRPRPLRPARSSSASPPRPGRSSGPPRSCAARASTCSSPTTSPRRAPASGRTPTGSRSSPPTGRATTCRCSPKRAVADALLDRVAARAGRARRGRRRLGRRTAAEREPA